MIKILLPRKTRQFCTLQERFRTKWIPVRVKKTRQNKNLSFAADSIRTEDGLEGETVKGHRDIVPWLMTEK
jgi:hypothetical protein